MGSNPKDRGLNRRDQEGESEKEWLVSGEQWRSKGEEPGAGKRTAGGREVKGWRLTEARTEPGLLGHGDVCVAGVGVSHGKCEAGLVTNHLLRDRWRHLSQLLELELPLKSTAL